MNRFFPKILQRILLIVIVNAIFVNIKAQQIDTQSLYYTAAFLQINSMLSGVDSLDFKKAVFLTEDAFNPSQLSEKDLENHISFYVSICKRLSKSGNIEYSEKDKDVAMAQCATFLFMTDKIPIETEKGVIGHVPFSYNFDDFAGQKDWSNMFVSTMMETNTGNCHSMPYLYKMIMDELGQESYLALAPNHMYIKVNNKKVGWYNIELTCGDFPTDAWLMASGYVHIDAIRNGIYMKALTEKESVALTLVDLAQGYQAKFGMQDGSFMLECCDTALKHFPNYINALLLKAEILTEQYEQSPDAERMKHMTNLYTQIHELGYRKMPSEMYMNWLKTLSGENTEKRMHTVLLKK